MDNPQTGKVDNPQVGKFDKAVKVQPQNADKVATTWQWFKIDNNKTEEKLGEITSTSIFDMLQTSV